MFYWVRGIDFSFIYWIIAIGFIHFLLLWFVKLLHNNYYERVSKGNEVYFNVPMVIPQYKKFRIILTILSLSLIIYILATYIIQRDRVYGYKVDHLNSFNYGEILEKINDKFKPDNESLYDDIYDCNSFLVKYSGGNLVSIHINFYYIKNNEVHSLNIYNEENVIIMYERKFDWIKIDELKNKYYLLENNNNYLNVLQKLDLNVFKSNMSSAGNKFLITHKSWISYRDGVSDISENRKFVLDKTGNITEVTNDLIDSNNPYLYYHHFQVIDKESKETIDYFFEK